MTKKAYIIIVLVVLSRLTGFTHAADNRIIERYYNLSSMEFENLLNDYHEHNNIDSAMLCANVQASKYGKVKLTTDEIIACCAAFRYMSLTYLLDYYNYQIATENHLKAKQIADKYGLKPEQVFIAADEASFAAIRNNLENNFVYNKSIMDSFKKVFNLVLDQITSDNKVQYRDYIESAVSNLVYLAIMFDKTNDVASLIQAYLDAVKLYGTNSNIAEVFCQAVECYRAGDYDEAFEVLNTPITRPEFCSDKDLIPIISMAKNCQYSILCKNGKTTEALKMLLEQEQFLRDNEMPFDLLEVLQLIKRHYEMEGNVTLADKYSLLYYTTKDEFINKSRVGKMDQAKLNLELEETRDRIREMSYRQKMQTLLLWSAIIITLLALAILGVLYVNYRKTKRTNRLLYEKNIALLNGNKELRPVAESSAKPAQGELSPADLELLDKITVVMESSPEVFNEAFSLNRLAELVGSNTKYVSRAINVGKQCNFSVLLNEYRIKEACRRLMDNENYGNYTIEGIANSVGYKSRSNFATVFKESVGLTPSAFQKLSRDEENEDGPDEA